MDLNAIISPVKGDLERFEESLSLLLHSNIPLAAQVVKYIGRHRGKRLRPSLVLLACKLNGAISEKAIQAGVIVELLHTATLVHDDVVDNSDLRRGDATVNKLWSNKISVLVGDLLFAKTLSAMLDLKDHAMLSVFSEATKQITEGELMQIERDNDFEMDEADYFDLVSKKTASLFSASCELGALAARSSQKNQIRMRDFGQHLGIAFQIKDDLLDYVGDQKRTGKPTGNDIRENKVTLPLIFALKNSSKTQRDIILTTLNNGVPDDKKIKELVGLVNDIGGVQYSLDVASQYADMALEILSTYPDSTYHTSLKNLVEFTVLREN